MPATALRTASAPSTSGRRVTWPRWALPVAPLLAIITGLALLALASPDQAAPTTTPARSAATSSTSVSSSVANDDRPGAATVDHGPVAELAQVSAASEPAADARATEAIPAAAAPPPVPAPAPALSPVDRWRAEGILLEMEGQEWDEASLANVNQALAALPARVRALLGNRELGPMHILVNREGRTLSGNQPYGRAANFFSTNEGRNELVLFPGQSVMTTVHELGHAFNLRRIPAGRYALVLLDDEMASFMAAAGWQVLSTPEQVRAARDHTQVQMSYRGARIWARVSNDDPLEDFANSFALYFLDPQALRQLSPERFAWFEANVGR